MTARANIEGWTSGELALLAGIGEALLPEAESLADSWTRRILPRLPPELPAELRSAEVVASLHRSVIESHLEALRSGRVDGVLPRALDGLLSYLKTQLRSDEGMRTLLNALFRSLEALNEVVGEAIARRFPGDARLADRLAAYAKLSLRVSGVVGSAFYYVRAEDLGAALRVASSLLEASRQVHTRSATVAAVLAHLTELVNRLVRCDKSLVFLWQESEQAYAAAAGRGFAESDLAEIRALRFRRGDFPMMDAILEGDLASGTLDDGRVPRETMERYGEAVYAVAPMTTSDGRRLGTLAAYRQDRVPFDAADLEILRGTAENAALAIENALLVEKLEEASRIKTDFINSMSHEIRTPLHVLVGYLEMLTDRRRDDPVELDLLERMRRNAGYLLKLVNTILDAGRIEAGRMPVHVERFTVAELLDDVVETFRATAETRGITLVGTAGEPLPPLATDRLKLLEVLGNLVSNALKFTDRGSVTVDASAENDLVRFDVSDTGPGIEQAALGEIFEVFRQAGPADRGGGAGLGLYIVKRLTELLGGRVSVASRPGRGTTFTLRIPPALPPGVVR